MNQGWAEKWKVNNWFRNKKERAINIDLWKRLLDLTAIHEVTFNWVKGHSGHAENERCDFLATAALNKNNLLTDDGYLSALNNPQPSGKIENEGDKCRKCNAPVIKRMNRNKKRKANQKYYFKYYFVCVECKTNYMVEKARVQINNDGNTLFDYKYAHK